MWCVVVGCLGLVFCGGFVGLWVDGDDGGATPGVVGSGPPFWLCVDEPRFMFALADSPLECRRPCSIRHPFYMVRVVPASGVVSAGYVGA